MTNYNETIKDIIKDIRENDGLCISPTSLFGFDEDGGVLLGDLAERIKLAHEREMAAKDAEIERCRDELRATRERRDDCETKMRTALERVTHAESKCDTLRKLVKELVGSFENWVGKYPPSEWSKMGQAWQLLEEATAEAREVIGGAK